MPFRPVPGTAAPWPASPASGGRPAVIRREAAGTAAVTNDAHRATRAA
jgi:hypothetical protein